MRDVSVSGIKRDMDRFNQNKEEGVKLGSSLYIREDKGFFIGINQTIGLGDLNNTAVFGGIEYSAFNDYLIVEAKGGLHFLNSKTSLKQQIGVEKIEPGGFYISPAATLKAYENYHLKIEGSWSSFEYNNSRGSAAFYDYSIGIVYRFD